MHQCGNNIVWCTIRKSEFGDDMSFCSVSKDKLEDLGKWKRVLDDRGLKI